MTPVFLDTVGILALLDEDDQWHAAASAAFALLLNNRTKLVSTDVVLFECGNAAARRPYRDDIFEPRSRLADQGALIQANAEDVELAWQEYRSKTTGLAGIVDCISFNVMRRLKILVAFTNDKHFTASGFQILF